MSVFVMIKAYAAIFINFMALSLQPFQPQVEMKPQISFSRLKLSHLIIQGEWNSSLMRTQEYLSLTCIIFNQCVIIFTNLMLPSFVSVFILQLLLLCLLKSWQSKSLQWLWVSSSVSNLGHAYCWFSVFLLQFTNVAPGSHILNLIFSKNND